MRATPRQRLGRAAGAALAGTILLSLPLASLPLPPDGAAALAAAGTIRALGFGCWALAAALILDEPPRVALGLDRPIPLGASAATLAVLGCLGLSELVAYALAAGFGQPPPAAAARAALVATPGELAMLVAGVALAPAVVEELLFRGALLRGLARAVSPGAAIGLSALAFALPHLRSGNAIAAGVLGLYLALLTRASGGVRLAIVCHAANNGLVLAAAALGADALPTGVVTAWRAVCGASLAFTLTAWALGRGSAGRDDT